jgi:hypothetical protein
MASAYESALPPPRSLGARFRAWLLGVLGYAVLGACAAYAICLASWSAADASLFHSASGPTKNLFGPLGAIFADIIIYFLGLTGIVMILPPMFWALQLTTLGRLDRARSKIAVAPVAIVLLAAAAAAVPTTATWPLSYGYGGLLGDQAVRLFGGLLAMLRPERATAVAGLICLIGSLLLLMKSLGLSQRDLKVVFRRANSRRIKRALRRWDFFIYGSDPKPSAPRREPTLRMPGSRTPPRSTRVMEPSFASQGHRQEPHVDHFANAQHAPIHQPELSADETSDIARRFAPARREAEGAAPESDAAHEQSPAWQGRGGNGVYSEHHDPIEDAFPHQRPVRPPAQVDWPPTAHPQHREPAFEDLYGRAVAIVRRDRKASSAYLRGCLKIGYMCASDLIERMEKDGIVGAPLYNGVRPILIGGPGSDEI